MERQVAGRADDEGTRGSPERAPLQPGSLTLDHDGRRDDRRGRWTDEVVEVGDRIGVGEHGAGRQDDGIGPAAGRAPGREERAGARDVRRLVVVVVGRIDRFLERALGIAVHLLVRGRDRDLRRCTRDRHRRADGEQQARAGPERRDASQRRPWTPHWADHLHPSNFRSMPLASSDANVRPGRRGCHRSIDR